MKFERTLMIRGAQTARALPAIATLLVVAIVVAACSKKKAETDASTESAAPVEPSAPAVVIRMIDAHGGMATWRSAPTVSFETEYSAPGGPSTVTRVVVEQKRRRAYIDFPDSNMSLAWDGKRAWSMNWKEPYPPRFLALLDYYFLCLPWLTLDPGVRLSAPEKGTLWDDPTEYSVVKMSFAPGTGDTPNDTYRLYIDPATARLKACAYTATYRAMLPDSVDAMPEHVVAFEEHMGVGGLTVPTRFAIYRTDHTPVATCVIRDWSFERPFDESRMSMPEGAVVDESTP